MAVAPAWQDAVAACIVGADRAGPPPLPPGLDSLATADGPGALLAAAAALGPWWMAGRQPAAKGTPLDLLEDLRPECSDAAAARLEQICSNTDPNVLVCREWCRLAATSGVQVPPGLALHLYRTTRKAAWMADADAVLGPRLAWLAALEGDTPPAPPSADDWTSPDLPRRAAALRLMRAADPAAGRDTLAAVWKGEPADARAALLDTLASGLAAQDEPFLDARLDDRSGPVRATAARLLGLLPDSGWATRMTARAQAAVRFVPAGLLVRLLRRGTLEVTLPDADPAARRDGLDAKAQPGAGAGAALLRQLVAAAPLAAWGGHPPADWIAAAQAGEWSAPLLAGWADAAAREGDRRWLSAVLAVLVPPKPAPLTTRWEFDAVAAIAAALPPAVLEAAVQPALAAPILQPAESLLRLSLHDWSPGFSRAAADWAVRMCEAEQASFPTNHLYIADFGNIGLHAAPDTALPLVAAFQARLPAEARGRSRQVIDALANTLQFRAAMHQEFAP